MPKTGIRELLQQDVRYQEGLKACMNCGICTALCPAAGFYDYDPRRLVTMVQNGSEEELEDLLKSDYIWLCGQCMSCKPRCPRGNVPGLIIMALRQVSQQLGYFVHSTRGRQQLQIVRSIGANILKQGYCVYPEAVLPQEHPEQGPVWGWVHANLPEVMNRLSENYQKEGPGAIRKIPDDTLAELYRIFEASGALGRFATIENYVTEYQQSNSDY